MRIMGRITVAGEPPKARKSDTPEEIAAASAEYEAEFVRQVTAKARPFAQAAGTGLVFLEVEHAGHVRALSVSLGTVPATITELDAQAWAEAGPTEPLRDKPAGPTEPTEEPAASGGEEEGS